MWCGCEGGVRGADSSQHHEYGKRGYMPQCKEWQSVRW